MERRDLLKTLPVAALSLGLAYPHLQGSDSPRGTTKEYPPTDYTITKNNIKLQKRPSLLQGDFTQTRVRKDGTLVLDDEIMFEDNFTWTDPVESDFDWNVRDPGGSHIKTHPEDGYISFHTTTAGEILEIEQANGIYYDFTTHPDWRFNVVERNTQSDVGAAWEFWFSAPPLQKDPWVLIDAGGGGNVDTTQDVDDSCGYGFYVRENQLLTKYTDSQFHFDRLVQKPLTYLMHYFDSRKFLSETGYWSANHFSTSTMCWDEFSNPSVDHSTKTHLSLEVLGSQGEVNAYVDDRLQADLQRSQGQYVIDGEKITTGIRLHDRGDHQEIGEVYYANVQKIGTKYRSGTYTRSLSLDASRDWTGVTVDATTPRGTGYNVSFNIPDENGGYKKYDDLAGAPPSKSIVLRFKLYTNNTSTTPAIHGITLHHQ